MGKPKPIKQFYEIMQQRIGTLDYFVWGSYSVVILDVRHIQENILGIFDLLLSFIGLNSCQGVL